MVKVECDGCKSPYQVDEKRIPPTGLRMRCPKCGTSLLVTKSDAGAAAPARSGAGTVTSPGKAPAPARAAAPAPRDDADLPVAAPDVPFPAVAPPRRAPAAPPAPPRRPAAAPPPEPAGPEVFGEIGLPDIPERPSVPDRRSAPTAPQRRGFGEIDLMVDLPAPTDDDLPAVDANDLPVVYGHPPPPPSVPSRAHARTAPATPAAFVEPDLPERAQPPGRGRTLDFGGRDSATVARPPGRGRTLGFGEFPPDSDPHEPASEVDLPAPPARKSNSVAFGFGELELPLEGDSDGAFNAVGASDLPEVASDLPSSVPGVIGMPSPAGAGLPTAANAQLPVPVRAGLPATAQAGFPATAQAGFPARSPAGFPATAQAGFPAPSPAGFPAPATTSGFPAPSPGQTTAGAGTIVGAELFDDAPPGYDDSRVGAAFQAPGPRPLPQVAPAPPTNSSIPPADFGDEIALGEAPTEYAPTNTNAAYDPSDRSANFADTPAPLDARAIELSEPHPSVGDEVDLTGAGTEIGDLTAEPNANVAKPAPTAEVPQRRLKVKRYVVATIAIAALGGGALALVPDVGAFGVNLIGDRLNAGSHAAELDELRLRVQAALSEDTAAAAEQALNDAKSLRAQAPRHRPTAAYAGYVAFARSIRFGHRTVDDALGKEMVAFASSDPTSDALALSAAAQSAALGEIPAARQATQALTAKLPTDVDVAVLAAEIELQAKDAAKAVAAWKHATDLQKSARTLFGLARAQHLAGEQLAAEASAKGALDASRSHVGARTLLASILWQSPVREAEALDLLAKVTEDSQVKAAASDAELVDAYTLLGTIHLARSRMSAADQAFAAALRLDPQAVRALIGAGELFYRSGRYSEALARFEAAVRADAESIPAKIGAAKTWLAQERMKEAKDSLKSLRTARPADPQIAFWLGRAELALGNKKEAEAAYLDAVKSNENRPEVVDAYVALASLLSSLGRSEEAAAKLVEATNKFPDLPALHKAKAEVALQNGRYEEARAEFEMALSKEDDLGTRFKLGIAYRRLRRFDEASRIFDKVAATDKDYPGLALERGLLFEETGQSERALEMYADALRKAPNDVDLKLRVGSTQVMAGHAEQAEPILREVLKDRPNSAEANHFLGRALLVRGTALAEALRFLERAAEIDPNRAEYHLYVGWGANETGQHARAEQALRRALELDAELGDAYWQRGVLLQKQGASRDALRDLQIALQKRPSRYEAYATMALCFQDQGDWAASEDAWRKAITANDKIPDWHYRLGKIYATRGNRAGATTELEQAITLGEAPDRSAPPWLFDAHFLLAESFRAANVRDKAIRHYQRFLELAPSDNAYRRDAAQALQSFGVAPQN